MNEIAAILGYGNLITGSTGVTAGSTFGAETTASNVLLSGPGQGLTRWEGDTISPLTDYLELDVGAGVGFNYLQAGWTNLSAGGMWRVRASDSSLADYAEGLVDSDVAYSPDLVPVLPLFSKLAFSPEDPLSVNNTVVMASGSYMVLGLQNPPFTLTAGSTVQQFRVRARSLGYNGEVTITLYESGSPKSYSVVLPLTYSPGPASLTNTVVVSLYWDAAIIADPNNVEISISSTGVSDVEILAAAWVADQDQATVKDTGFLPAGYIVPGMPVPSLDWRTLSTGFLNPAGTELALVGARWWRVDFRDDYSADDRIKCGGIIAGAGYGEIVVESDSLTMVDEAETSDAGGRIWRGDYGRVVKEVSVVLKPERSIALALLDFIAQSVRPGDPVSLIMYPSRVYGDKEISPAETTARSIFGYRSDKEQAIEAIGPTLGELASLSLELKESV